MYVSGDEGDEEDSLMQEMHKYVSGTFKHPKLCRLHYAFNVIVIVVLTITVIVFV